MGFNKLTTLILPMIFVPVSALADQQIYNRDAFYVGADVGLSSWYDLCDDANDTLACDDSSLAYFGKFGYRFSEGARLELDAGKIGDFTKNAIDGDVLSVAARMGYDFYSVDAHQFTGYLGLKWRDFESVIKEVDDFAPELGIGYQYYLTPAFSLGLSYFHGLDISDNDEFGILKAGFHYYFGQKDDAIKESVEPRPVAVVEDPKPEPVRKELTNQEKLEQNIATNIYFGSSSASPRGLQFLSDVIDYMKDNKEVKVHLVGHTDSVGSAASNMRLSVDRANAVRSYLMSQGVSQNRIMTSGKGETQPIASNETSHGRLLNRRVELTTFD
ncbi:OmpA family protein [Vibrio sonorensis]|uniref:OmpA family protein n=1 Tax=Vibrio sonorensis TaxID=1004316 RepID=UPI0008D9E156|nr:OmpA family protein [Vibrio sonorensis]